MKLREDVAVIEGATRAVAAGDRRIGGLLVEQGKLSAGEIERVLQLQQRRNLRFGEAALRAGLINGEDLRDALARQYDFPQLSPEDPDANSELVVAYDPFSPRAEQLRALRTQLRIRWSMANVRQRTLAIASPGANEGRSHVVANLAIAFSQLGERTLLVDADLRAPRQHRIFDVRDQVGLAAVLAGRAGREAVVPLRRFGALSLLPAGAPPPNPQELVSREALATLLAGLRSEYDVILIDTPPALRYADAQCLAFRAGSVMVLARKHHTRLGDTATVIRALGDTGARIIGSVLNSF